MSMHRVRLLFVFSVFVIVCNCAEDDGLELVEAQDQGAIERSKKSLQIIGDHAKISDGGGWMASESERNLAGQYVSTGKLLHISTYESTQTVCKHWTGLSSKHSVLLLLYKTNWPFTQEVRRTMHTVAGSYANTPLLVVESNCTLPAIGSSWSQVSPAIQFIYNNTRTGRYHGREKDVESIIAAVTKNIKIEPSRTDYEKISDEKAEEIYAVFAHEMEWFSDRDVMLFACSAFLFLSGLYSVFLFFVSGWAMLMNMLGIKSARRGAHAKTE